MYNEEQGYEVFEATNIISLKEKINMFLKIKDKRRFRVVSIGGIFKDANSLYCQSMVYALKSLQ